MSQDPPPYRTEFSNLARMQVVALPSLPHMYLVHTLEGLAQRAAKEPENTPTTGHLTFHEARYGFTYEVDHAQRSILVTGVSSLPA